MERTVRELCGLSCIDLENITPAKQQIICSRSFGNRITEKADLREAICEFTARAAKKLRMEEQHARALTVFIRTSPFDEKAPYYADAATGTVFQPTSDTFVLLDLASSLFDRIWQEGHCYYKAGVMLGDFTPKGEVQYPLLGERTDSVETDSLMQTIDRLNQTVGKVWFGGQRPKKDWFMRQDKRSPAYTTRWDSLPLVS